MKSKENRFYVCPVIFIVRDTVMNVLCQSEQNAKPVDTLPEEIMF